MDHRHPLGLVCDFSAICWIPVGQTRAIGVLLDDLRPLPLCHHMTYNHRRLQARHCRFNHCTVNFSRLHKTSLCFKKHQNSWYWTMIPWWRRWETEFSSQFWQLRCKNPSLGSGWSSGPSFGSVSFPCIATRGRAWITFHQLSVVTLEHTDGSHTPPRWFSLVFISLPWSL